VGGAVGDGKVEVVIAAGGLLGVAVELGLLRQIQVAAVVVEGEVHHHVVVDVEPQLVARTVEEVEEQIILRYVGRQVAEGGRCTAAVLQAHGVVSLGILDPHQHRGVVGDIVEAEGGVREAAELELDRVAVQQFIDIDLPRGLCVHHAGDQHDGDAEERSNHGQYRDLFPVFIDATQHGSSPFLKRLIVMK